MKIWSHRNRTEFAKQSSTDVDAYVDEIKTFADYLQLEERLFKQLNDKIYTPKQSGNKYKLERYTAGSAADFHNLITDWNRSFEFITDKPRGAVLLLHGMSDSLRALAQALNEQNYQVVGLRLPGQIT